MTTAIRDERIRDMGQYLGQLATLASGAIVVLATFSESAKAAAAYAVGAVSLFAYSIVAAMLARIMLIFLTPMTDDDPDLDSSETVMAWALSTGLIAFALGVVALAIYAGLALT